MTPEGVAVIGMAGRFPGSNSLAQFWENLCAGRESIRFFEDHELTAAGTPPALLRDPLYVKAAARLADVEWFDADFFGYTPKEAAVMDPQHRIFLECTWEALEEAGYAPDQYDGAIGVYAGTAINSYLAAYAQRLGSLEGDVLATFLGNAADFLSTRVSYKLNLRGPSLTIQTACSTSLVATHLACQSLLIGECDMALAGGVSIKVTPTPGYFHQPGGIASPDGRCRPFDAKAQGTLFGDGAGVVVLKRLADALEDRDHVYAVIRGTAINNDGASKVGYTAPSVNGQAEVVAEALAMAGVEPDSISYVEAHGTGTALGDPVEVAALTQAYRGGTERKGYCALGSIKGNIGHLDAAAGVAGLIKTVMALHYRKLPPSLHFEAPNPEIDFAQSPFFVNAALRDWEAGEHPRRAGVSSFGMGGTNAHMVLEEAPASPDGLQAAGEPPYLFVLSAKTESALRALAARYARYFEIHPDVAPADAAFTSQVGRAHFGYRLALLVDSVEQVREALASFVAGREDARVAYGRTEEGAGAAPAGSSPAELARAFVAGAAVDWAALHAPGSRRRVSLPVYPFERRRHWLPDERRLAAVGTASTEGEAAKPLQDASPVRQSVEAANGEARLDLLTAYLREEALAVLGLEPGTALDTRQGFFDMGMESLAALELKSRIETGLRCSLPATFAMNYPNVESLAGFVAREILGLDLDVRPQTAAPSGTEETPDEGLDRLSEDDLAALLDRELAQVLGAEGVAPVE